MAAPTLKQQLETFIQSMFDQGVLNQHFEYLRETQDAENPCVVSETIVTFIEDADAAMAKLTRLLSANRVNFNILNDKVHQFRGSCGSLGGCRIAQVCRELRHACNERNKEKCIEIFERLKLEYQTFRDTLNRIRELEDAIYSSETGGGGGRP